MKRTTLLVGLAATFIVLLTLLIKSEVEQTASVNVPRPQHTTEAITLNEPSHKINQNNLTKKQNYLFSKNPAADYYELNSDYMGWIQIDHTRIDHPVVRGTDNIFYLNHDFYQDKNILGSIFMDYRNIGMGLDKHTILYGHYTKNGLMFADLEKYLQAPFTLENPLITFNQPYENKTFRIFSVHISPADSDFIKTTFQSNEWLPYIQMLKDYSLYPLDATLSHDAQILTLVSCNYSLNNGRLYIHAYEVKENERN